MCLIVHDASKPIDALKRDNARKLVERTTSCRLQTGLTGLVGLVGLIGLIGLLAK